MANLNAVTIELNVKGEREAAAALNRVEQAQGRYSQSVLDSARKQEGLIRKWDELTRLHKRGTLNTEALAAAQNQLGREFATLNNMYDSVGRRSTKRAKDLLEEKAQTASATAADKRHAQAMEDLRMRLDPVYRASQRYKESLRELIRYKREVGMGTEQYRKQVGLLKQEFDMVSQGGRGARRSMNNFNLGIQQVGYQVSDFAIQVQSGTSAFVAFSQQASQLVGILPLMAESIGMTAGKAIALSSGLAIAIPLITVAGNVFWEMSKEAKEAEEKVNSLDEALKRIDGTLKDWIRTKEAASAGVTLDELFGIEGIERAEASLEEAQKKVEAFERLLDNRSAAAGGAVSGIAMLEGLRNIFGTDTASEYEAAVAAVEEAEQRLFDLRNKQLEQQREAFLSDRQSLLDRIELRKEELRFGNESAEAKAKALELEIAAAIRVIDLQEENQELTTGQAEAMRKLVEEALRLEAAQDRANIVAERLSSAFETMSMDNILSQMDQLNVKLGSAIFGAGTLTARLAGAWNAAVAAAERANIQAEQQQARAEGFRFNSTRENGGISKTQAFFSGNIGFTNSRETIPGAFRVAKTGGGRGGGRGGGGGRPEVDYLEQLEREAEFKRSLVGLSEEQARVEERRREITERLTKDGETLTETQKKRIESLLQMEAGTRRLIEAEEQRTAMIETFESQMESALMSMVDGSKTVGEAFSGLIRSMLLEIYKQQVAKPGAEAFGNVISALFKADGGAFDRGVEMFADGGVVGGATAFRHSGGLGVMGEAGPEAIMPLKRGANGKLGVQAEGGGSVVVNQYFNISANGDDSVRRIVRSEAPRIAEQAKAAVVDAKRRGGAYGRAF